MIKRTPTRAKHRSAPAGLLVCALVVLLGSWPGQAVQAASTEAELDANADTFRIFASELVVDLDRLPGRGAEPLTLAVWPHAVGEVPVPARLAAEINDRLLSALLAAGGQRYRFVARDALRAVVEEVAESNDLTRNLDAVLGALAVRAKADVLVVCKLRDQGEGRMVLSYRAVDVAEGTIVAFTSHRVLAMGPEATGAAAAAMGLEQALAAAVTALAERTDDMESLHLQGIQFEDSGQETPFGRYVEGRLADALAERYENPLTGRSLELRYNGATKGLSGGPEPGLHDVPGAYRLSGHYWDFGEVVELRLSLQDHEGPAAIWRQRIRTASIPGALRRQPLEAPDALTAREPMPEARAPMAPAPRAEAVIAERTIAGPPAPSPRLVRRVQRGLRHLGYGPGLVDGIFGPRTRGAIRRYQADHGLAADGRITAALTDHLDDSLARLAADWERPEPWETPEPWEMDEPWDSAEPWVMSEPRAAPALDYHGQRVIHRDRRPRLGGRCREVSQRVTIAGRRQEAYGLACQQADGSWLFVGK